MNRYFDGMESSESQDFEFDDSKSDFACCTGSLNALRGRVLASAHRAAGQRRTRRAVWRLAVILVCCSVLSSWLPALADARGPHAPGAWAESVAQVGDSEWELVDAFVRVHSHHRRVLRGSGLNDRGLSGRELRHWRQTFGVSGTEGRDG